MDTSFTPVSADPLLTAGDDDKSSADGLCLLLQVLPQSEGATACDGNDAPAQARRPAAVMLDPDRPSRRSWQPFHLHDDLPRAAGAECSEAPGEWLRYIGGAALLVFGAVIWPLFSQFAEPVGVWLVAALSGACFVAAYRLLAPPDMLPFVPFAERNEATRRFALRDESSG